MSDIVLSILVLAAIVMVFGAVLAWRHGDRKRAGLMLLLTIVMAVNVGIWTIPAPGDATTLSEEARKAD
ncbi:hypothetical protein [Croceicoccus naphthovorans]|uniref:Uncharacterized protein n=1 Tax=Croceicoccus naphthovorans TaxID=1348774 RepID=A0A0G3XJR7_9SPHN|nr:hypothetical protein [Croceicoccus naphthovorans]AKM10844.1 hypothetical protein AB433_14120 [Croceicoccus naphthovorans]MBB3989064.1 hypothetical protein [Croceicoccus naphthovorans]